MRERRRRKRWRKHGEPCRERVATKMSFDLSAVFPFELAHLDSGSGWKTDVVATASGAEQRNAVWADALRKFNATTGIKTLVDVQTLQKHFNGRRASARAFPILDRTSYLVSVAEGFG